MIPRDTIDRIVEAARIEDVVGDFVTLKRRGANLLGVCPFHNEKTPSFTVSPSKGIYKCFGCSAAGNSVNFVMQHESLTYPEALRYLARKYGITIEEREITPEEKAQQSEKESLYIITSFAQKYFTEQMTTTDEGKSIGLGYFKERGFREDIIEKFQLGYSPEGRTSFTKAALKAGYLTDYLVKTGVSIVSEKMREADKSNTTGEIKAEYLFDRYAGRVIFPIQHLNGRVIGFGGRILGNDKKQAKYINSPQTDIYDKSKVLYGLFFAKKSITQEDNCFLVEGYTDVISMHQAGIENVVASSGTALTVEQIRLIHRFTNNITVLYDGDWAGIKASFRGIDLILEQGMNVRVLLFPDNEDPDSYSRRVSPEELKKFIRENTTDFIRFKTNLLYGEAGKDPLKKAGLIKDIVESISLIPDAINRSVYIQECSRLLETNEQLLGLEVNKIRLRKNDKKQNTASKEETVINTEQKTLPPLPEEEEQLLAIELTENQEAFIMRTLLLYGDHVIEVEAEDDEKKTAEIEITVAEYIFFELKRDGITFLNPVYQQLSEEYHHAIVSGTIPDQKMFIHHTNPAVAQAVVHLISGDYKISDNWSRFGIYVEDEKFMLKKMVQHALFSLKDKRLMDFIFQKQEALKSITGEEDLEYALLELKHLQVMKARVNKLLGRTIIR